MAAASGAPMGQDRLPGSSTRCWRVSCLWAVGSGSRSGPRELLGIVSLSPWSRGHLHRAPHDSSGFVRGRERNRAGEGGELQGGGHGLRSLLSESPCRKRVTGCRPRTRGGDYTSHVWRQNQNQTSEWLLRVLIPLGVNILMFCYKNVNGFNLRGCPRPRQKDYVIYSRHTF